MLKNISKHITYEYVTGLIFTFLCIIQVSKAQLDNSVYEDFNRTIVNPYLVNPSTTDTSYNFKLRFNNINQLGLFRNVRSFYVDGDKRFQSSDKNEFHYGGLQMTNSKLGDFISRSRFQVRYGWYAALSRKAALASGISLGFINYSLLTTQGGSGGSDFGPDGAIGVHYLRKRTSIGFAVKQIFNPVLLPVNQSFRLNRLYNADVTHEFRLGPRSHLTAQSVAQLSEEKNLSYSLGLMAGITDIVLLGINHFSLQETSLQAGLQQINILEMNIRVLAAYSFYHSNIPLPDNSLEIFIAIQK